MILKNPNMGAEPGAIRDPMIVRDNGKYYMVGSSPNYWEGYTPGVRLWSSDDLVNWKFETVAISEADFDEDDWRKNRFWAPELFIHEGKYYITVTCKNEKHKTPFGMFIAVADKITGPYTMSSSEPFYAGGVELEGIDAHLFCDDDGTVYFFYGYGNIYMAKFDMKTLTPAEPPRTIVERGKEGEWDSIGVEGPFCVKRNGIYYLWYSSWTRGYEMGWATTTDLSKPFTKWPSNPIISCDSNSPFDCVGHNGAFVLPDGRDAISFHGHKSGDTERLCIDTVTYPMENRAPAAEIEI